jgi:hypothetical protein
MWSSAATLSAVVAAKERAEAPGGRCFALAGCRAATRRTAWRRGTETVESACCARKVDSWTKGRRLLTEAKKMEIRPSRDCGVGSEKAPMESR